MGLGKILWPFKWIVNQFKKLFNTKAGRIILTTLVEQLLPAAIPIVQEIQRIIKSPSAATYEQIKSLYVDFSLAFIEFEDTVKNRQDAVRDLAVILLQKTIPGITDIPLIKAAIELALAKIQAEEK